MISICIPIYNYDVRPLVNDLTKQIQFIFDTEVEIILIDDASDEEFRQKNKSLQQLHEYIQLNNNVGRSRIRNLFLQYATQPYLLFMDCDSSVENNDQFIENYLNALKQYRPVICYGGRVYPYECPSAQQSLSWKYGTFIESQPAIIRQRYPKLGFQSNNFIIHRSLFQEILFDESLKQYGHEDTLFGIELAKRNISILHIENPVLNHHIEDNLSYIDKNRLATENLVQLIDNNTITPKDYHRIKLLSFYQKINQLGLSGLFYYVFRRNETKILDHLNSKNPNLKLFNLYKLYLFIKAKKRV
ncbi:glycosyltransferase family 2 protein [Faecalibacter sp. LW9]|uniref:glycosyltransferase family 2 protein n=1 Tax=Faecalibacter sp. LW9 TaxID=3103144 RepID=UPI002AFEF8CC|nr:glycosyltransferase family 2 protein [Faecalibacter sp. LW9]